MNKKTGIMALVAAMGVTGMGFAAPMTNFERLCHNKWLIFDEK